MMRVRMKPSSVERFEEVAEALGLSAADAHRRALAEFVIRNEKKVGKR